MAIRVRQVSAGDFATCSGLLIGTICLCVLYSRHRILWSDEIFGWMLVDDPSFRHMLRAWRAGADGGGIWFYLLGRAWLDLLGHTALAFRFFSATGTGVAAALTFLLARTYVRWSIAAFSVALIWFTSDVVLWQMMQARFYGLLLTGVAAAGYVFVRASRSPVTSRGMLAAIFLCHTLLVGTHPFGAVYSGATICAMVAFDVLRRRRPTAAVAALAGWWILLPSWQAIESTAAVGRPHFWTTRPTASDLLQAYSGWSLPTAIVLGVSGGLVCLMLFVRRGRRGETPGDTGRETAPLLFSLAILLVPLGIWLASQGSSSVFVDRYLVPTAVGLALVLARLLGWLVPEGSAKASVVARRLFAVAAAGFAVWAMVIAVVQYPGYARYPGLDQSAALVAVLPRGLPIVIEPVDLFDQLAFYHQGAGLHYVTVLDWRQATGPNSLRGEVAAFHQMENWRRVGYFADSIEDSDAFLVRRAPFVVVELDSLRWFADRVRGRADYTTELLRDVKMGGPDGELYHIWLVRPRDRF